jgi:hypothetical protein
MSLPRAVIRSFKFFSFIIVITFIYKEISDHRNGH